MSKDTIAILGSRAVAKYDCILSNVGGSFYPSTGIFIAPYKGVNSISCSLMSDASNNVHLTFYKEWCKNVHPVFIKKTRNLTPDRPFSYCLLSKGDKIWIQNRNARVARLHDHGS